jgi:hypothetical protein
VVDYVWSFLDEARAPDHIVQGAIVVTGDADDAISPASCGAWSVLRREGASRSAPGGPFEYIAALAMSDS